ncbi:Rho GTPase-activating protein 44 [Dissostichus eleginoides]|uniref:Rho GTPase-activating protein 44 n=2 Tax=Notothenioidei TaxID=8205 RepID=A0AAD9EQ66_DISEL|nr:Rho GTPase-activating protein 44 [Dissostichus eleginoides]
MIRGCWLNYRLQAALNGVQRRVEGSKVEKRLDLVKQVTHSTHKKLTACLQGQQGADVEKRSVKSPSKKLPLTILAQCMVEGAAVLGDDSLLGKMLMMCGETEEKLAQELILFEFQIERDVVEPMYVLAEVDIPNIQKQRKHLAKLVLDMDSARTRFHQSSKSSSHPSTLQPGAKAESLREEMEEAANRMEICRDQLSADMYSFVAKEIDYANYFQTLIETQAEYHRKSLEILQSILPQIKAHQEAWVEKPSYGKSLEDHLNISGREIAFPIEACVTMLLECGMQEEGLFRIAPSASKLKKLKASLDCGVLDVQEYSSDPHAIAGALKSYLRELPEPLMTTELYDEWIQASNIPDLEKRLQALMAVCEKLPTDNLNNFRYLIKFLAKLTDFQDDNKMTPGNQAIVLGPNLLWTHTEPNMTEMMTTLSLQIVSIVEPIIQHADWFFPGEIEFNLTGCYGSPIHSNHNSNYSSMPSPDMDQSERKQQHDQSRRPLSVATDNMMLEFYKKDGMGVRVMDTSWVSRKGSATLSRKTSSTPPGLQGSVDTLIPEQPGELACSPSATPPLGERICSDNVSPNRPDTSHAHPPPGEDRPPPPLPHLLVPHCPPPLLSQTPTLRSPCGTGPLATPLASLRLPPRPRRGLPVHVPEREDPPRLTSSFKSKELSPVIGHKGIQVAGSKKLAPVPPKVPYSQSCGMSDQSTGQPSPVSLSPTPPSTPSPYGLACPPGQVPPCSPGQTLFGASHSLSSPPSLTGTLTKSRPAPKPRQRPSLPPPQPPTAPQLFTGSAMATVPQPLEQGLLDGLSPGESMSTGKHQPLATTPPPPPQVGLQRPSLRLAVALSNGDGGRV